MRSLQMFRLISLHHIWHNKVRTLFVLLVIAMASVSMFVGVDAIFKRNDSRLYGLSLLFGRAQITIEGQDDTPITEDMLQTIRMTDDVEVATPLIMDGGLLLNQGLVLPLIGIDPDTEPQVRLYNILEGGFITKQGEVLITDAFAADFSVGDTIRIVGKGGIRAYTIVGILAQNSIAALNGGDMLFLHYSDIQAMRGNTDVDAVHVVPNGNAATVIENFQSTLPHGLQIDNLADTGEKTLTEYVIDALGIITNGLPVILGALMITSTMAAGIAQRRNEIAILRSLGTTQSDVLSIFIVEATILGFIGALFGVLLAFLLNQGALTASVNVDSFSATATGTSSPIWLYGLTIITGIVMAIGAIWIPARRMTSIDPTAAMRKPINRLSAAQYGIVRIGLGILFLVLAVVARFAFDNSSLVPMAVLTGIVFVPIGMVLLFPPIMLWVSSRLSTVMQRFTGFSGLLASENLNVRHQRAVATGLTALLVIWFFGFGEAFSTQINYLAQEFVDTEYNWDIIISGAGAKMPVKRLPVSNRKSLLKFWRGMI